MNCSYPAAALIRGQIRGTGMNVRRLLRLCVNALGYDLIKAPRHLPIIRKHTRTIGIEVLLHPAFQASCQEVAHMTLLDTARLANLWQLCRMSNPNGAIIEVGAFMGGSALHLSNSSPSRRIYVCDTFEGFRELPLDPVLDRTFSRKDFTRVDFDAVKAIWQHKERDAVWLKGYFPDSAKHVEITPLSFAHVDVDIYESVRNTLQYLGPMFLPKSIIVFDDYLRNCDGVMRAVKEFEMANPDWHAFPIYPGQGVMIHRSWFEP
jgi:O-methyltransferase